MIMKKYGIQLGMLDVLNYHFRSDSEHMRLYFCSSSARRSWLIKHGYKFNASAHAWVHTSYSLLSRVLRFEPSFITFISFKSK